MALLVWKTVSSDSQLILTFSWDGHGTISQSVTLFQLQKGWSPGCSGSSPFFTHSNLISSTYLIWFKSLCHLRQFLDALLWSGGARTIVYTPPHKPLMLLTHKTCSNTQSHNIRTYSHLWSKTRYFDTISFSHRRFCLEEQYEEVKHKLWNLVNCLGEQLPFSRPRFKSWDHEIVPWILASLGVKQEASLDTQKEPAQLLDWLFMLNTQTHLCISE